MAFAAVGLVIFNLFMVVPAAVYAAVVTAMYISGLVFYLSGVVITAGGLSGSDEVKIDGPLRHIISSAITLDGGDELPTRVTIGEEGIRIITDRAELEKRREAASEAQAAANDAAEAADRASESIETDPIDALASKAASRAEAVVSNKIAKVSESSDESRATQVFVGIGLVLGGILLLLLCLAITRYTFIGIRRYIEMNIALLKGH
jgi:hypothetical protein